MFWESVLAGLKVLTYWETYIAGFEYLAILFAPLIIVGIIMEKGGIGDGVAGCFTIFFMPVLQVVAMAVMLLSIAPIIFGFADDAAWSFPWKLSIIAPSVLFKLIIILIISALALIFIPILGTLQPLHTLITGGIVLAFVLNISDSVNQGNIVSRIDFIPDFWFSIGLIIIGGILSWIGMMVAALIISGIEMILIEGIGPLIMFPIGSIFGFLPVFIYGAWLGGQVKGGF